MKVVIIHSLQDLTADLGLDLEVDAGTIVVPNDTPRRECEKLPKSPEVPSNRYPLRIMMAWRTPALTIDL